MKRADLFINAILIRTRNAHTKKLRVKTNVQTHPDSKYRVRLYSLPRTVPVAYLQYDRHGGAGIVSMGLPGMAALLDILLIHINYLCTYDLYRPVHNVLDACISIKRASGRVGLWNSRVFWAL